MYFSNHYIQGLTPAAHWSSLTDLSYIPLSSLIIRMMPRPIRRHGLSHTTRWHGCCTQNPRIAKRFSPLRNAFVILPSAMKPATMHGWSQHSLLGLQSPAARSTAPKRSQSPHEQLRLQETVFAPITRRLMYSALRLCISKRLLRPKPHSLAMN